MLGIFLLDTIDPVTLLTQKVTAFGSVVGLMVTGFLILIRKIDKVRMERIKEWDEFDKTSLTRQLDELTRTSTSNQEKMRVTLHEIAEKSNRTSLEYEDLRGDFAELRKDFVQVSDNLREANKDLHRTNQNFEDSSRQLTTLNIRIVECEADRDRLRQRIIDMEKHQVVSESRIAQLEKSSFKPEVSP